MQRRSFLIGAAAISAPVSSIADQPVKVSLEEFLASETPEQRAFWHLKQAAAAMKEYSGGAEYIFGLSLENQAGYLVRKFL
ncbi:hypothetical protein [Rhizobium croatiense]|uniref:hypothetical protein n=1 Tax=Rhizobium croatiense TaxID=2867516 RepID=UPI0023EB92DD|nr:hypothetical protein [Rhizobium croatiense]WET74124.1 hypothetical protein PYR68_00880 [Rhizobium croatiense]